MDSIPSDSLYMRALNGMLLSLDPYSQLLSPKDYEGSPDPHPGELRRTGNPHRRRRPGPDGHLPHRGHPAYKAGLLPGDRIVSVDGADPRPRRWEKAVQELRGPQGSEVTLSIAREGWTSRSK